MSEAKHTPGPWVWVDRQLETSSVEGPNGEHVAGQLWWDNDTDAANAHLISAAPELLAALECCVDQLNRMGMDDAPGYRDAVYVIAKAKGTAK